MKEDYHIIKCDRADIQLILDGINDFNLSKVAALAPAWTPLEFAAKDSEGKVIGGILGGIGYWNGLEIRILWVEETCRHKGIGTRLLEKMEKEAKARGATIAMLDTFDFQAEGFYLKNSYEVVGTIHDFPKGHRRMYFKKYL
ncbi:MAG: GNAT family N-acetyltransferase [Thermonemataceae bacterium]